MVGQALRVAGLEQAAQEGVLLGNCDDEVDALILRILTDGIQEVVLADKEELEALYSASMLPSMSASALYSSVTAT